MLYSRSSEYAIRACIHLARIPEGKCAMAKDIAMDEGIPAHFLAKILQILARKGLLKSVKGPSGGFCFALPAAEVRIIDIIEAIDGLEAFERCAVGRSVCSDAHACELHKGYAQVRSRIMRYLETTRVGELARGMTPSGVGIGSSAAARRKPARRV